jgi:hypothetical protein
VQGSEAEPYTIQITSCDNKLTASCTCRAAFMGQLCKHRLSILNGDGSNVISENRDEVALIPNYLNGTETEKFMNAYKQLEDEKKTIDNKLKKLKKMIFQSLS